MVWNLKDYLPDLKGTLNNFYEEKSTEYKTFLTEKFTEYKRDSLKTQQALIAIALGIFFLLLIAYFWK